MPSHTKPTFKKHSILALPNLIAKNYLIMMHKIRLNVAPIRIREMFKTVDTNFPRREPVYFEPPYNRLWKSDKTLKYKGPILYNKVINELNKNLPKNVSHIQNRFITPFKRIITSYILQKQNEGGVEWESVNFVT